MNICLNSTFQHFSSPFNQRFKPFIYIISALAIGILVYQCCCLVRHYAGSYFWSAKKVALDQKNQLIFDQLIKNSNKFASQTAFPTSHNLIKNIAIHSSIKAEVVEHANDVHPILHSRVLSFIPKFLEHKKKYGSSIEQKLYQDMKPLDWIDRFITKRPLAFFGQNDRNQLRNGSQGKDFLKIGTDEEKPSLSLENYQSYSEMALAALISMFVPTHFINNGARTNQGQKDPVANFERKGVYVGMVGARFERPGLMEWAHMIVTPKQNKAKNGYGKQADPHDPKTMELRLWAELYQSRLGKLYAFPDYKTAKKDQTGRYLQLKSLPGQSPIFLDTLVYKERMRLIIENFLLESNDYLKKKKKQGYLHLVGLGLGVWIKDKRQTGLLLDVYADVLRKHKLEMISDLDFSWFDKNYQKCGNVSDGEVMDCQGHKIHIHFSKRNPADKLKGKHQKKLLIAQYAWDSNAFPGNEYWLGMLSASGDPAAACCSTIPELQNHKINPNVSAARLTVFP